MLKIRQAKPDVVISNLSGTQITSFMKQYSEYGLPFTVAGFGFDTALAWGAGADNFLGTWPVPWHHDVNSASSKAFVTEFVKRNGKPPENQAWGDYLVLKIMAESMNAVKSTDSLKVIDYMEKGAQFDVLKTRKGYFRSWDHQLIQEMYTMTPKAKGAAKDKWDFLQVGSSVPSANEPLDIIAPTKTENNCTFS
jgi:branched-chain amino acid transport system substrate-binding protein